MNGCFYYLLVAPLGFLVTHPVVAFFPATLFLLYYLARRPAAAELNVPGQVRWSLVAGLVWIVYGFYEMAMYQWSKTVMGAIRVDLFLVLPVLFLLTAAAVRSGVAFERGASRGLDPVKPIRPGPYALSRNRRFVLGFAIALATVPVLSLLFRLIIGGAPYLGGNVIGLLVTLALAFFLVQGHRWAKWCLVLFLVYSVLHHVIGWTSLRMTGRQDMEAFRHWHLVSLIVDAALLAYLLFSKRLRQHIDVHSYPESTRISPS
jgi:hypothetical protein